MFDFGQKFPMIKFEKKSLNFSISLQKIENNVLIYETLKLNFF